jgi:hypothetical protein
MDWLCSFPSAGYENHNIVELHQYLNYVAFTDIRELMVFTNYLENRMYRYSCDSFLGDFSDNFTHKLNFIHVLFARVQLETSDSTPQKEKISQLFHEITKNFVSRIWHMQRAESLDQEISQRHQAEKEIEEIIYSYDLHCGKFFVPPLFLELINSNSSPLLGYLTDFIHT